MKSLYFDKKAKELVFLDRSLLPEREEYRRVSTLRGFYDSLNNDSLCGTDAVAASSAFALTASAYRLEDETPEAFYYSFSKSIDFLEILCSSSPPVRSACEFMRFSCEEYGNVGQMLENIEKTAFDIEKRMVSCRRKLGKNGEKLISDGDGIFVRGNCGILGGAKYGASLSAVYAAYENKKDFRLYVGETYPSMTGKRLAAYELEKNGLPFELITDSDAALLMSDGRINKVFIDVYVTEKGGICSEPGSLILAAACKSFGVPLWGVLPSFAYCENKQKCDIINLKLFESVITGSGKPIKQQEE